MGGCQRPAESGELSQGHQAAENSKVGDERGQFGPQTDVEAGGLQIAVIRN